MNKKSIVLFLVFLFLIFVNFVMGALIAEYGIKLLDFITFTFFNVEGSYWDKSVFTQYAMYLYFESLLDFSIWLVPLYSILCYWLYNKYQGLKFFLVIFGIFVVYFFCFCLYFSLYRFSNFLTLFSVFCLMYLEIVLLYKIRAKIRQKSDSNAKDIL